MDKPDACHELFLATIVEHMPAPVVVKDGATGRFLLLNRAGEELLDVAREDHLGRTGFDIFPEEQAARFAAEDCEVIASGQVMIIEEEIDTPRKGRRAMLTRKLAVRGPEGASYLVAISEDVTERKQDRDALEDALARAEAASRAKSSFLATMSHEIRTPLNGVLGMAQAMARDELTEAQRERLQIIQSAGETLLTLLNDVLDLSKIEAGRIELEDGIVDLEEIAAAAQATFSSLAREKDLYLTAEIEPEARGAWRGDPARVRQILHNLIGNAVKFTDRGSVTIRVAREAGQLVLSVKDTGPGIALERQVGVFEKFAQADASTTRRYGGTGLGLSICRELAGLMGGDIRLESAPGEGARFEVRLPLQPAERPSPAHPKPTLASCEPSAGLRVLAAEDNPMNQIVLKTLLAQVGLDLTVVADGEAAVQAWEDGGWDVILMDVQMPVMDGPTAARVIRERERRLGLAPTPIIALTANAMSHHAEEYRSAGMDALVAKPISMADLFTTIEAVVSARGAEAEAQAAQL